MAKRRFAAQETTIYRELRNLMATMGATSLKVNQDIFKGDVEVIFDRAGKRYKFENKKYQHPLDNLRAAQLTITYLWRALEEYGTTSTTKDIDTIFDRFFLGFTPAPDDTALLLPSGQATCWDTLGIPENSTRQAITNAFRALAKTHHPDYGGHPDDFKKLRAAYEEALRAIQPKG